MKKPQEKANSLSYMVDCGTDHHHHHSQTAVTEPNQTQTLISPPAATTEEKDLRRVLEAGLMINGLKVLLVTAAEKIDLHVSHNAITPGLLQELDDIAKAITLTTKKLNSIKSPCCDLYARVPTADDNDVGDSDD